MKSLREIMISAMVLMLIAGLVTAALAGTNALTKDTIRERTEQIENAARLEVINATDFEKHELAVDGETVVYYTALQNGENVGYVFTATVVGKSSGLVVMTGISADGKITGVKITDDNETAGYVDKVVKAGFLDKFKGHAAQELTDVDAVSQATKTSNGVRKAVGQAIAWYQQVKGGDR